MIELLVLLVVLGFVAWMVLHYVPMAEPIRSVVIGVMVLFLALGILSAFGLIDMPVGLRL